MVDTVDATLEGEHAPTTGTNEADETPDRVGRYVIVEPIGRGGMGIVFAAYDPELDRKVAIKLLDPRRGDVAGQVRLLREAQAMAKLQHPNVVAVHDVGTIGDRVFVAMEFVRGRTLGQHLAAEQRPWREVLALLVAAGRGLAAAHEVGLVHRDFKPDNVLVSDQGRVQVGDFGLARAIGRGADSDDVSMPTALGSAASLRVTRTGALVGTPAYMAPEQYAGGSTDARTDQFAFCVAAYEALYGERPIAGTTPPELAAAVLAGETRLIPRTSRVPLVIGRAIVRGLATDPPERWPDMNALLTRLERAPRRIGLRWGIAGAITAALVTLAAGQAMSGTTPSCAATDVLRASLWDDAKREEVEHAVLATEVSYAADTWQRLDRLLDAHARAWAMSRFELCDAEVRHEVSDDLFDRRMTCLARREHEVTTLVDLLAHADASTIQNAVTAASQLTPPTTCDDTERLLADLEPPATAVEGRVADVRARLDAARVIAEAGRLDAARAEAVSAAAEADALAYRPLRAEAQERLGWIYDRTGEYAAAEAALREAWLDALATGHDQVAATAAAALVHAVGVRQTRFDDGVAWAKNAEALLERRHDDAELAVRYHANLGNLFGKRGDHRQAIAELRTATALAEERSGRETPGVAQIVLALGLALRDAGDYPAARVELERARDIQVQALGAEHPAVATTLNNLASVVAYQGGYAEARPLHEQALAIRVAALGPDHPDTASSHSNLGATLRHLGEWDEASRHLRLALEIKTRVLGPDDPQVAGALTNLGNLDFARGDFAAAEQAYRHALEVYTKSLGPEHPDVGAALNNVGVAQWKLGELDDADATLRRALALWERALGPVHPDLASTLLGLGQVALAHGRPDEAIEPLTRALAVREHAGAKDDVLAQVRFALAQAIVNRDPARAYGLAEQAAETYGAQGESSRARLEAVEAFLAGRHAP